MRIHWFIQLSTKFSASHNAVSAAEARSYNERVYTARLYNNIETIETQMANRLDPYVVQ
jgi:hypothetical protein